MADFLYMRFKNIPESPTAAMITRSFALKWCVKVVQHVNLSFSFLPQESANQSMLAWPSDVCLFLCSDTILLFISDESNDAAGKTKRRFPDFGLVQKKSPLSSIASYNINK